MDYRLYSSGYLSPLPPMTQDPTGNMGNNQTGLRYGPETNINNGHGTFNRVGGNQINHINNIFQLDSRALLQLDGPFQSIVNTLSRTNQLLEEISTFSRATSDVDDFPSARAQHIQRYELVPTLTPPSTQTGMPRWENCVRISPSFIIGIRVDSSYKSEGQSRDPWT